MGHQGRSHELPEPASLVRRLTPMTATIPKRIRHGLFRNCSLCPSQTAGGEAARLQVKSMRNNISWLEPDLRQPKDRLTLLARVVGRLITTVDPARLDHVLFELLGSALRLDAFLSYDSTDDSGLRSEEHTSE